MLGANLAIDIWSAIDIFRDSHLTSYMLDEISHRDPFRGPWPRVLASLHHNRGDESSTQVCNVTRKPIKSLNGILFYGHPVDCRSKLSYDNKIASSSPSSILCIQRGWKMQTGSRFYFLLLDDDNFVFYIHLDCNQGSLAFPFTFAWIFIFYFYLENKIKKNYLELRKFAGWKPILRFNNIFSWSLINFF